jgi:ADP-heptose:LPS heptosyltransferase
MKNPDKHKIIFRLSALGDVVLTTGVLGYWARKYGWKFTVITKIENASILENNPFIEKIIALEKQDMGDLAWLKKAGQISAEYSGLDLIDLHKTLRSSILKLRWKGNAFEYSKYGFKRRLFNLSSCKFLEKKLCETNVPQRYALAVEKKAPKREELLPEIYLTENELEQAKDYIAKAGLKPGFTALHPYATHPDKTWPQEKWKDLISELENENIEWAIIGKDQNPLLPGTAADFTNDFSLRQTCAVLKYAGVLVTGDSGPMHLASGVSTPVVSIFGPTSKAWGFYPSGKNDVVLEKDLPCRPCSLHGKNSCKKGRECLCSIKTQEVVEAIKTVLGNK